MPLVGVHHSHLSGAAHATPLVVTDRAGGNAASPTVHNHAKSPSEESPRPMAASVSHESIEKPSPLEPDAAQQLAAALATVEGTAELKQLFQMLDTNSDGRLSSKEWGHGIARHPLAARQP